MTTKADVKIVKKLVHDNFLGDHVEVTIEFNEKQLFLTFGEWTTDFVLLLNAAVTEKPTLKIHTCSDAIQITKTHANGSIRELTLI